MHKRNSSRVWPQSISSITHSSKIEDVKYSKVAEDLNNYLVQIKTIKNDSEKKKMRQSRILMNIIQSRIEKEMMTWTCIPNIVHSPKAIGEADKRFKVLKPSFDKSYVSPKATSLFTLSRVLSRKNSPVKLSKIDQMII